MNLSETPVINLRPSSVEAMSATTQELFKAVCARVEETESVKKAREAHDSAVQRRLKLQAAHTGLNKLSAELFNAIGDSRKKLEDGFIEQYLGSSEKPDTPSLVRRIVEAQAEHAAASSALQRTVDHESPLAVIAEMRTNANLHRARANEFNRIAEERMEATMEAVRDAVEFEVGLAIDTRYTFTGLLVEHAHWLTSEACQIENRIRTEEQRYREACNALANRALLMGR